MTGLLRIIGAIAIALGVVAMAVFGMSDGRILTAPPERRLDEALVILTNRRYAQVRALLSHDMAERVPPDSLRSLLQGLERRIGRIGKIDTEREWMRGDSASAVARLEGERGRTVVVRVPLLREQGVWRIADLSEPVALAR